MAESRFAVVVMLPDDPSAADRVDFAAREFATIDDITLTLHELEARQPNWRLITFCHVEDLPLLMEPPKPPEGPTDG